VQKEQNKKAPRSFTCEKILKDFAKGLIKRKQKIAKRRGREILNRVSSQEQLKFLPIR